MRFRLSFGKDAVFRLIIYLARIETSFRSKFFAKDFVSHVNRPGPWDPDVPLKVSGAHNNPLAILFLTSYMAYEIVKI